MTVKNKFKQQWSHHCVNARSFHLSFCVICCDAQSDTYAQDEGFRMFSNISWSESEKRKNKKKSNSSFKVKRKI